MDYKSIIDNIYYGLTGHNETDIKYLMDQAEKYREHEYAKEIAEACGQMIAERVSPEQMEAIRMAMDTEKKAYNEMLMSATNLCKEGKADEALKIIEPQISLLDKHADEMGIGETSFSFEELFEELIYTELIATEADVKRSEIPFSSFYSLYGAILMDLGRIDEAETAIEKAMKADPVGINNIFEYSEILKKKDDIEGYERMTKKAFEIAFRPYTLARCYRNMGYIFIEREMYREAVACYMLSLRYDRESKNAHNELYYIEKVTGKKITGLTYDEVCKMSEKYGFPMGPDEKLVSLAYSTGKYFYDNQSYGEAVYFLEIAYSITGSEQIAGMLESISKNSDNAQ